MDVVIFSDGFVAMCVIRAILQRISVNKKCKLVDGGSKRFRCMSNTAPPDLEAENKTMGSNALLLIAVSFQTFLVVKSKKKSFALAIPSLARFSYDYSLESSKFVQQILTRQCFARQHVAKLLTLGGGWACLRQSPQAMECTRGLYTCALVLGDTKLQRKCSLFRGWALLWSGQLDKAIEVLKRELAIATQVDDDEYQVQCQHALLHAMRNPSFASKKSPRRVSKVLC